MRRPEVHLWLGCAVALAGCAGGQGENTSIGATTLPVMTAGVDTGDSDDDDDEDDEDDDGFDDRGDDDEDDDDDRGDDDDDDDDDGGSTDGDTGTGDDDDDDDGPTSSLMLHFNTEGAFLTSGKDGMDNAPLWESSLVSDSEDVPAYGDATRAGQIQSAFESIIADYPFDVVTKDPGIDAKYTMILLTDISPGTFGFPASVLSVSVSDCDNANANNVILVFDQEAMDNPVDRVANAIAYSLGTASGLNSNTTVGDVMNSAAADTAATFSDQCVPLADEVCPVLPAGLCDAGEQNSHEALEASFP